MPADTLRSRTLPLLLFLGDAVAAVGGLCTGFWLRYRTDLGRLGIPVEDAEFRAYLPLLLVGAALLLASFAQLGVYDERLLLRRYKSLRLLLRGLVFWFFVYLGTSLVLKFEPPISRLFVVVGMLCCSAFLVGWRVLLHQFLARTGLRERLRQRVAVLGWSPRAAELAREIASSPLHPLAMVGRIELPGETTAAGDTGVPALGDAASLESLLRAHRVDVLVSAREPRDDAEVGRLLSACERAYCEWKLIPAARQVFMHGLRLETVGAVPLLGSDTLPVHRLFNRLLKRTADIVGGLAGLLLSAPFLVVLVFWIRRDSAGPAFFGQQRVGLGHRTFTMWKLRTMRADAAASDHVHQSTLRGDPRVTPLGRVLRRWNLDELPQFWNVLRGDMSLVGPRPERPLHVDRIADAVPHYLPRHLVKPGMTGWAQVSGLRGATSLEARTEHDIYYIENWSLWLDLQILALTLLRWRNPSE